MNKSSPKDILSGLDPMQRQAASFHKGTMLVLAGPGSGKTHVITKRVQYLIEECGVRPENILVITFTKAAAKEMQERSLANCETSRTTVFGTFHSVFFQILKRSSRFKIFRLMTDRQKNQLVNRIIRNTKDMQNVYGNAVSLDAVSEEFLAWMSYEKNSLFIPLDRKQDGKMQAQLEKEKLFQKMYALYQEECLNERVMDFDDILCFCHKLFLTDAQELCKWQEKFAYILVDEFQDINPVQFAVLNLLAKKRKNLFLVGDDDQSIYSFRGSDVGLVQSFLSQNPESKQITLGTNYRSTQQIVDISSAFIANNENRFKKQYHASRIEKGEVQCISYQDRETEKSILVKEARKRLEKGESVAFLFRTNREIQSWAKEIKKEQLSLLHKKKMPCVSQSNVIDACIAVLQFVHRGQRRADFLPFMNKPERFILREMVEDPVDLEAMINKIKKRDSGDTNSVLQNLLELKRHLDFVKELDSYAALHYILHVMKFKEYIEETYSPKECKNIETQIDMLFAYAKEYPQISMFLHGVKEMHDTMNSMQNPDKDTEKAFGKREGEKVFLLTYHASKGLEFDHVFLPDVNAFTVPRGRYLCLEELEEERRMFYVAMTRAKNSLTILYEKKEHEAAYSPFILQLLEILECQSDKKGNR